MPKPEPTKRERTLDAPIDWAAVIEERIAAERQRMNAILPEVIATLRDEASDDLEHAVRTLGAELADLKATLAELRTALASDRREPLDLPQLLLLSAPTPLETADARKGQISGPPLSQREAAGSPRLDDGAGHGHLIAVNA